MATFAVSLRSKPQSPDGILMLIDERSEADEIALELARHGQDVTVWEVPSAPDPAALARR
jgi:hypothetical protein